MALDLLAKTVTFEVQHKPGYRLKIRSEKLHYIMCENSLRKLLDVEIALQLTFSPVFLIT